MSRLLPGLWLEPDSWEAFEGWLADCFASLDVADVFEVGPAHHKPSDDDETVPCIQIVAFEDRFFLLRLGITALGVPVLRSHSAHGIETDTWHGACGFQDGTHDCVVSTDIAMMAAACVTWFRDRHRLDFRDLGCGHHEAVALPTRALPHSKPCQTRAAGHGAPGYYGGGIGGPDENWATILELDGEVIVLEMPDGHTARFRHHDPDRFATAVEISGGKVVAFRPSAAWVSFLAVPNGRGHDLFGVAKDEGHPLDACDCDRQS